MEVGCFVLDAAFKDGMCCQNCRADIVPFLLLLLLLLLWPCTCSSFAVPFSHLIFAMPFYVCFGLDVDFPTLVSPYSGLNEALPVQPAWVCAVADSVSGCCCCCCCLSFPLLCTTSVVCPLIFDNLGLGTNTVNDGLLAVELLLLLLLQLEVTATSYKLLQATAPLQVLSVGAL